MKKKKFFYFFIVPLLVLLLASSAALFLTSRTIGWPGLFDLLQLPQALKGKKIQQYEIDKIVDLDLNGIKQIKLKAVNETITVLAVQDQARAQLKGHYKAGSELNWQVLRQGDQLLLEAVYPRFGLLSSDLDLIVQLPDSFTGGLEIDTVSGQVDLPGSFSGIWSSLVIKTVSADVNIASLYSKSMTIETVSGQIDLTGEADQISCETVSGAIKLSCTFVETLYLESVSGNISLQLADKANLSLIFSSLSGRLRSENLQASSFDQGKGKTKLELGDGSGQAVVKTTSGDFHIKGYSP